MPSSHRGVTLLTLLVVARFATAEDRVIQPASNGPHPVAGTPRATFDFNPGWRMFVGDPTNAALFEFDDSTWKGVTLPRAWNEDAAFKMAIDQHPTGIAWYRKQFRLPPSATGKKVFLEFEGVRQAGEFFLNG